MPPHPQDLSPRSPNVTKYDDDVRRRLANSLRAAKKSVGRKLTSHVDLLVLRRRIPPPPTGTARTRSSFERRLRKCKWSPGKLGRDTKGKKNGGMVVENGGVDQQLYRVVSEGQWSGYM